MRVLLPLPRTVTFDRRIGASRGQNAERFGNAQARTVEQRNHGGVAGGDPGLLGKLLAGRDDPQRVAGRQRSRQRLRQFRRAQGGRARGIGEALALQMAQEGADGGEPAADGPGADAFLAAVGEKGTQVGGPQRGDVLQPGRPAAMAGQELEELPRVALVSLDGEGGQAPFARQHAQPRIAGVHQIGLRGDEKFLHGRSKGSSAS
jgi:hypothetical protein